MDEYKPVPVQVAADIAKDFDKSIVIVASWDNISGLLHITTYGDKMEEKAWAASGGEIVNKALGGDWEKRKYYENYQSVKCGDANPKGNVSLTFKGGCGISLNKLESYRCTGCGGWFHKDCILKHFELEKEHDFGRQQEREKIISAIKEWGNKPENWSNTFDDSKAIKLDKLLAFIRKTGWYHE